MLINPRGFAGRVADPAVAVVLLVKLSKFKKNNCHARVGLPDWSDSGDVGIL
jgi:hypothetical protein